MREKLACFKAYDIRGRVPEDLNEEMAYKIGRAYAVEINPSGPVAVGRDIRQTSESLSRALIRGLNEAGVPTRDIGMCGTEVVYFAAGRPGMGGGIMVTASHNPMEYNGMKFVRENAIPISSESGLAEFEQRILSNHLGQPADTPARNETENVTHDYVQRVLSFANLDALKPLNIVVNGGNGCAGPFLDRIAEALPFSFVRVNHEPDGTFPNGIPNPLLSENQPVTANAVRENAADMGVAWDGDFDRCFFFDENGSFVDGYYLVGLLAKRILQDYPGATVVHDPRMTWNTIEIVKEAGGRPVQGKTGHAFVKELMRREDAAYGGEMSAHHYFRDFSYCDSGMIPWLLVATLMCETGKQLSELVAERVRRYPASGEINSRVDDAQRVIETVEKQYAGEASSVEHVDGLSMEFGDRWRFNLRASQTEPILRLNVEARGDRSLMEEKTQELLEKIRG